MQYNQLGDSDLKLSEIGLGTMTFGQQNTLEEAHQQLDYAIAQGVNFIDTAEMYPVPPRAETQGLTEAFIGQWLATQPRDRLILATKIAGPSRRLDWIRDGSLSIDRRNIEQAVDDSLKRLQTDYIDLYQIHWSDRYTPIFGNTVYDPQHERPTVAIAEQLAVFADLIRAGKIRYVGLSNETPWGVTTFCQTARQLGLPKVVSIQNAYNLINRVFDSALAEACYQERVGVLAYSPLGGGYLSGKYQHGNPENARMTLFPRFVQRYYKPNVQESTAAYVAIAQKHNLSPTHLALAFVRQRWFVTSSLVGATSIAQLKENLASLDVTLDRAILAEIDAVHQCYPSPAP